MVVKNKQWPTIWSRWAMIGCLVILLSILGMQEARSETLESNINIKKDFKTLTSASNKTFQYELDYFINQHGEKEVQIALTEAHWLAHNTQLVVLKGRDTNSDGFIETWFYTEGSIVKSFQRKTNSEDVWSVAQEILKELSLNESRWISTLAARELLAGLFFTIEGEIQDSRDMEQKQIDLLDLDYKIKELSASNENSALVGELKRVSNQGWQQFLDHLTRGQVADREKRVLGDVALFIGGGVALKGVRFLLVKSLSTEAVSSIKVYMREGIEQQKGWMQKITSRAAGWLPAKKVPLNTVVNPISMETAETASVLRFASEGEAVGWLSRNTVFTNVLRNTGNYLKEVASASWDHRGYVAMAQTLQLAIETYNRGYWKFSETPLILDHPVQSSKEFINQVANDKGLLQNFSYMTLQTTLLSSVSEALNRRGAGLATKYAVCSLITLSDSAGVNILIQGSTNYQRMGFDTAWELVVGGSQVHLDLHLLRWANGLAEKTKKPKLKLVGYLLASIDQGVGYFAYNKTTGAIFEKPHSTSAPVVPNAPLPPAVIVPVMAPQG